MSLISLILIERGDKTIIIKVKNENWSSIPSLEFIEDIEIVEEGKK